MFGKFYNGELEYASTFARELMHGTVSLILDAAGGTNPNKANQIDTQSTKQPRCATRPVHSDRVLGTGSMCASEGVARPGPHRNKQ
jgi:hypothetical protein